MSAIISVARRGDVLLHKTPAILNCDVARNLTVVGPALRHKWRGTKTRQGRAVQRGGVASKNETQRLHRFLKHFTASAVPKSGKRYRRGWLQVLLNSSGSLAMFTADNCK
jgi:hypothetical protein